MTYSDHLIRKADTFWSQGQRLPIDLFAELIAAGLDVHTLELQHMKEPTA